MSILKITYNLIDILNQTNDGAIQNILVLYISNTIQQNNDYR